jgi:hypothetical protein
MPVKVNPSETEQEFIGRCIGIEKGYGKDTDQATAICYSIWENRNMNKSNEQRVLSKINRINLLDPNPCQTGYIAYGTKIKDGREVPNCIPID